MYNLHPNSDTKLVCYAEWESDQKSKKDAEILLQDASIAYELISSIRPGI